MRFRWCSVKLWVNRCQCHWWHSRSQCSVSSMPHCVGQSVSAYIWLAPKWCHGRVCRGSLCWLPAFWCWVNFFYDSFDLQFSFHYFSFAVFHILTQFSTAVTYSVFVTLGLITSVPVSAGKSIEIAQLLHRSNQTLLCFPALDIALYGANFAGMKLGGVILISIGFFLVMFPNNWPDYIIQLLRWGWSIIFLLLFPTNFDGPDASVATICLKKKKFET